MRGRCHCGATPGDRALTQVCYISGCPFPEIARRAPKARERDLAHDADPARFGHAVTKCEGYTPDCAHHGRCMRRGECFASPPHLVAARMIATLLPDGDRVGVHNAYIRRVVEMLREGRVDI